MFRLSSIAKTIKIQKLPPTDLSHRFAHLLKLQEAQQNNNDQPIKITILSDRPIEVEILNSKEYSEILGREEPFQVKISKYGSVRNQVNIRKLDSKPVKIRKLDSNPVKITKLTNYRVPKKPKRFQDILDQKDRNSPVAVKIFRNYSTIHPVKISKLGDSIPVGNVKITSLHQEDQKVKIRPLSELTRPKKSEQKEVKIIPATRSIKVRPPPVLGKLKEPKQLSLPERLAQQSKLREDIEKQLLRKVKVNYDRHQDIDQTNSTTIKVDRLLRKNHTDEMVKEYFSQFGEIVGMTAINQNSGEFTRNNVTITYRDSPSEEVYKSHILATSELRVYKLSALSDVGQHVRSLEEFRKEGHMAFQHCSVNRDLKLDMLY